MPLPLNYRGTQWDWKTNAIDIRPIEPSILEGTKLVTSMYGPEATIPLEHTPPENLTLPTIVGNLSIPNTLECLVGTWKGSPYPYFAYQWMADGVDIPNATNKTWVSEAPYDGQEITCEVRGYSNQGEAYVITEPVTIVLVEPDIVDMEAHYLVTGHSTEKVDTMWENRSMVISGMGALKASTIMRSVAYSVSGKSGIGRSDVNDKRLLLVTGITRKGGVNHLGNSNCVGVVNLDTPYEFVGTESQQLPIINPTGNMNMFGWTANGPVYTYPHSNQRGNSRFFRGGDNLRPIDSEYTSAYQLIPVPTAWETDIDAGTVNMKTFWEQFNGNYWEDMANIKLQFLTNTMALILEDFGPGMIRTNDDMWYPRESDIINIPANTRYIRMEMEWLLSSDLNRDDENEAFIRNVSAEVWNGTKPSGRETGPDYTYWRVKFDTYNIWNGIGLAELEMRDAVGGVDQCTGGTILAGSSSLGGDPSYAFDDIRNNGFWAGELNGVSKGTAWLGYQFGAPWKPREIDITGRDGANAAQMAPSFYLEGSNDGVDWTRVQYVRGISEYTHRQQKQFEIFPTGPIVAPDVEQTTNNVISYSTMGNFCYSNVRMDITGARMWTHTPDGDVDITLFIFSWFIGSDGRHYVKEVLGQSPITNIEEDAFRWEDFTLQSPVSVEVAERVGFAFSRSVDNNRRFARRQTSYGSTQISKEVLRPWKDLAWSNTEVQPTYRMHTNTNNVMTHMIIGNIF